ncbi:MAG: hypothetical protein IPJ33_00775 [Gammaproteobacteria bacterium]|nr:hypothetical protein [Gammaproteobacteria bacterium]
MVGGYERAARALCLRFSARGHDVTVITERRETLWPAREEMDGVRIQRLWCIYRPRLHLLTSLLSFSRFLMIRALFRCLACASIRTARGLRISIWNDPAQTRCPEAYEQRRSGAEKC